MTTTDTWISRNGLLKAVQDRRILSENHDVMEEMERILDGMECREGVVSPIAEWEKVSPTDPTMDATERAMFRNETYRCTNCGEKSYFGASCKRDRYCQRCGALMQNAGRRS